MIDLIVLKYLDLKSVAISVILEFCSPKTARSLPEHIFAPNGGYFLNLIKMVH